MHQNSIKSAIITKIDIIVERSMNDTSIHQHTRYSLYDYSFYYEQYLFTTKEELLKSL